jgi:hypothetical protein
MVKSLEHLTTRTFGAYLISGTGDTLLVHPVVSGRLGDAVVEPAIRASGLRRHLEPGACGVLQRKAG